MGRADLGGGHRSQVGLNHSATFAYDGAGRLEDMVLGAARRGDGPATGPSSFTIGPASFHFTYAYDGLQNMTSRTASGPSALELHAGAFRHGERGLGPRQLSTMVTGSGEVPLTYDGAGRVSSVGGRTHAYNGLDQLVQVEIPAQGQTPAKRVSYAYGYDGLRTITEAEGVLQYWLTPNLVERNGRREWYLRQGSRTLVRLSLEPRSGLGLASSAGLGESAATAELDALVRAGRSGLSGDDPGLDLPVGHDRGAARTAGARSPAAHRGPAPGGAGRSIVSRGRAPSRAVEAFIALGDRARALLPRRPGRGSGAHDPRGWHGLRGAPLRALRCTGGRLSRGRRGQRNVERINHHAEPLNALNKETDPASGYSDHGARWLSPQTATWLTPDAPVKAPAGEFLASPWDLHPYQYVRQSPTSFWDPDGRSPVLNPHHSIDVALKPGQYQFVTRSFAPFDEFGGGYEGDGDHRGFRMDAAASARIIQSTIVDGARLGSSGPGLVSREAWSDETSAHGTLPRLMGLTKGILPGAPLKGFSTPTSSASATGKDGALHVEQSYAARCRWRAGRRTSMSGPRSPCA